MAHPSAGGRENPHSDAPASQLLLVAPCSSLAFFARKILQNDPRQLIVHDCFFEILGVPNATHDEQQSALLFIYNFAKLYPCLGSNALLLLESGWGSLIDIPHASAGPIFLIVSCVFWTVYYFVSNFFIIFFIGIVERPHYITLVARPHRFVSRLNNDIYLSQQPYLLILAYFY